MNKDFHFFTLEGNVVDETELNKGKTLLKAPNFIKEIYELSVINNIRDLLLNNLEFKNKIFLDIGSHIGFYTILLGENFTKTYAFEPSELQYQYLQDNALLNKHINISISKSAVGSVNSKKTLYVMGNSGGTNTLRDDIAIQGNPMKSYEVDLITLDSQKIDNVGLIKIDVEGYELDVLIGAKNTIIENKPIILCEVWDNEESRQKVSAFFESVNYSINFPFEDFPELAICNYKTN